MKKLLIITLLLFSFTAISCSKDAANGKTESNIEKATPNLDLNNDPIFNEVDYSNSFNGIIGSAVFYTADSNTYNIFNKDLSEAQISPFSTFKIINSLMALSQGVVTSTESTLGYDGTIYSREELNKNLTLKEAFQTSALWYYEKIMDRLDKEYVQDALNYLEYGNRDLSEWSDTLHNTFWINGSLEISPIQQIKVLEKIFEGKSKFSSEHIALVKDLMLTESNDYYSIYGKTGSAKVKDAWFIGFVEIKGLKTYFAVSVNDKTQEMAGSVAKSIAIDIIQNHYL